MPITGKFYLCGLDFGKFRILAIWGQTIIEFASKQFQNFVTVQNFLPKKKSNDVAFIIIHYYKMLFKTTNAQ
jgi:hypothetical protein